MVNKKKEEVKQIPISNYIIVLVVSLLVVVLVLYLRSFYLGYQESKLNTSYFSIKKVNEITKDDIEFSLSEYRDAILYVGYTGSKSLYDTERKIYKELEKNNLIDIVVYFNATDLIENNEYLEILKKNFPELVDNINDLPLIIIIKDGKGIEVINSEFEKLDYKELRKVIKKNEIE
jgi:hypothetical protein